MADKTVSTRIIDHIVHLTPPGTVEEVSDKFRELGWSVLRGGVHADGLTANALVVLKEGSYLELISFTHPVSHYPPNSKERADREAHRWATKAPGWIDFAFLGNGSLTLRISDIINARAKEEESGVVYSQETAGGRVRPDGEVLKWLISAARVEEKDREQSQWALPFFCGDVTPRSLRVQTEPASNTEHPNTVQGVAYLRILVSPPLFELTKNRLTSVIGKSPLAPNSNEDQTVLQATWDLDTPQLSSGVKNTPRLILQAPSDDSEEETSFVESSGSGTGIYEVAFYVEALDGGAPEKEARTPQGRIRFVRT